MDDEIDNTTIYYNNIANWEDCWGVVPGSIV